MISQNQPKSYKQSVDESLGAAFGIDLNEPDLPIIEDMLEWQNHMDNAPASINMRGARRFWQTVAHHLGRVCFTDGSPDINEVVIPLTDTVGLLLKTDYNKYISGEHEGEPVLDENWSVSMEYRFVRLDAKERYTP